MFKDASEILAYIEKEGVALVDVRFCDLPGMMQHFTIPVAAFEEDALTDGLMFDGSSIRGFTAIHESDMKLVPDVTTAYLDPFREEKTLVVNFSIVDPFTDERFSRDPRSIAAKAEDHLYRRHLLHRRRGRVLPLRLHRVRDHAGIHSLRHRLQ